VIRRLFAEESVDEARTQVVALFAQAHVLHPDQRTVRVHYANCQVVDRIHPPATAPRAGRGHRRGGRTPEGSSAQLHDGVAQPLIREIDRHLDAPGRHTANGLRPSEKSTEKAHSGIDLIDAYDEAAMATAHLDADELDTTQRETRLFDVRVYAEAIADDIGRTRSRAGRTPQKKADQERQRDEGRSHPCASLAEEPQHRGGIMPRRKRKA